MSKIFSDLSKIKPKIEKNKWEKLSNTEQKVILHIEQHHGTYEDRKIDKIGDSIYKQSREKGSIKCDIFYKYPDKLIVIEIEQTKRPVESITKYWWLLESTDWYVNYEGLKIQYLIIFRPFKYKDKWKMQMESRREQVKLIGTYLSEKYDFFNFNELTLENPELSKEDLNGFIYLGGNNKILKLDSEGNEIWTHNWNDEGTNGHVWSLILDPNGGIVAVGSIGHGDPSDLGAIGLTENGDIRWSFRADYGYQERIESGVFTDPGTLYVTFIHWFHAPPSFPSKNWWIAKLVPL